MGYDFYAREDPCVRHRLTGRWTSRLLIILDQADLLDPHTPAPDMPSTVALTYERAEREDLDWPFDTPLDLEEVDYLGFRSADPGRVPIQKLCDNELWLITSDEAQILASGIDEILTGGRPRVIDARHMQNVPPEDHDRELTALLRAFGDFCRACVPAGGFWAS